MSEGKQDLRERILNEVQDHLDQALYGEDVRSPRPFQALKAVVEMHEPCEHEGEVFCRECNPDEPYPCLTLRTIAKELGIHD